MTTTTLTGSCLCGAVKYEVSGEPVRFYHCHCQRCRKATGTGHATNLFLQPGTLRWLAGADQIRTYKVPEALRFANAFCSVCGSRLPRQRPDTDAVVIPAGTLDVDAPIKPHAHIFNNSRAAWSCSGDELPVYEEYAPQ
jgi:hypothetical protein